MSASDFVRFLARWQHAQPGNELAGSLGLTEVIGQLQGFQLAAGAWEAHVLPGRVRGYLPALLDALCLSGEVVWGRFSPSQTEVVPSRAAPIGLALRADLPWLLGPVGAVELSAPARALRGVLARRGASFWTELLSAAGLPEKVLEPALWELVAAGEVTADGFAGLRALIQKARPLRAEPQTQPLSGGGRWSLLRAADRDGVNDQDRLEKVAHQLVRRYGVVFRDLLAREVNLPPWRALAGVLRTLEARGELRGGRFVAGFSGEQFALPTALASLRAVRRTATLGAERLALNAADPLNLAGVLTPGPRVPAVLQNQVRFVDGVPQAVDAPGAQAG